MNTHVLTLNVRSKSVISSVFPPFYPLEKLIKSRSNQTNTLFNYGGPACNHPKTSVSEEVRMPGSYDGGPGSCPEVHVEFVVNKIILRMRNNASGCSTSTET